jgi:hypothetical protein
MAASQEGLSSMERERERERIEEYIIFLLATCSQAGVLLNLLLTLKMEAICSSETSG